MSRHEFENRYCNNCKSTTRHHNREVSCSCQRCGVIKTPTRAISQRLAAARAIPEAAS